MRFVTGIAAAALMAGSPAAAAQDNAPSDGQSDTEARAAASAVQAHVNAYRSGNLAAFVRTFSSDATVILNGVVVASGHEEIRSLYRMNFVEGAPTIRIKSSGMSGDRLYLSIAYVYAEGGETCCSYSEYEVAAGKVTRLVTQG